MEEHYKNCFVKILVVLIIFLITIGNFGNIICGTKSNSNFENATKQEDVSKQENENIKPHDEILTNSPQQTFNDEEYWHPPVTQQKMSKEFIVTPEGNWQYWPYCPQYIEESPGIASSDTCKVKYLFNIDDSTVKYFYVNLRYKCLNTYGTGPKIQLLNKNEVWDQIGSLGRFSQWHTGSIYKEKTDAAKYLYNIDTLNPAIWADGGRTGDDFVTAWIEVEYQTGRENITSLNQTLTDDNHDGANDGLNITVDVDVGMDNYPESKILLTLRLYTPTGDLINTNTRNWTIHGTQDDPVTLHVSAPTGSQNGIYTWSLQVHDESFKLEDYRQGKITLYPNPQPVLRYTPNVLHFGIQYQGWTGVQNFEIWNGDVGNLIYTISENIPWVMVTPSAGNSTGEHHRINVTVINTGSMNGYYYKTINISSNGGNGSVFVDITIKPPIPTLEYSPKIIHIGPQPQGWAGNRTFEIWNAGQTTLSYTISENIPWITGFNQSSGNSTGEHDKIKFYVGNTNTMNGYACGNLTISSNGGTGQVFIDINITVKYNYPPNPPEQPNPPSGATCVNTSPTLSVFVSDPDGDSMDIFFYNASDPLTPINNIPIHATNNTRVNTIWDNLSLDHNYMWYVIADDGLNRTKSKNWSFSTGLNTAPETPLLSGPHWWLTNQEYTLKFILTDPDHDNISYYIDWGDHTSPTGWIGPYPDNTSIQINHTWPPSPLKATVVVKVKDDHELEGVESTIVVNVTNSVNTIKVFIFGSCIDRRLVGNYSFFVADSEIYWIKRQLLPLGPIEDKIKILPPGTELVVTKNSKWILPIDTVYLLFGIFRFNAAIVYNPEETTFPATNDIMMNTFSTIKEPTMGSHNNFNQLRR